MLEKKLRQSSHEYLRKLVSGNRMMRDKFGSVPIMMLWTFLLIKFREFRVDSYSHLCMQVGEL